MAFLSRMLMITMMCSLASSTAENKIKLPGMVRYHRGATGVQKQSPGRKLAIGVFSDNAMKGAFWTVGIAAAFDLTWQKVVNDEWKFGKLTAAALHSIVFVYFAAYLGKFMSSNVGKVTSTVSSAFSVKPKTRK